MSAFILGDEHIEALIHYAQVPAGRCFLPIGFDAFSNPEHIAATLRAQNVLSIQARYPDVRGDVDAYPAWQGFSPEAPVVLRPDQKRPARLTAVGAIKACNCYDYQSCETDDYTTTFAARIVDAIRSYAISTLPGYEQAAWEVSA